MTRTTTGLLLAAALAANVGFAQDEDATIDDAKVLRLAALLRLEDGRIVDSEAWSALDPSDDPEWVRRVALARRRVFVDPFDAAPDLDVGALLAKFSDASVLGDARLRVLDALARAKGPLPKSASAAFAAAMADPDAETAGIAARAFARTDGAADAEASILTASFLDRPDRIFRIDCLRALSRLPGGPSRPAVLAAIRSDDAHLRRVAFETLAAVATSLDERDRDGLSKIAAAAAEVDPVVDVRAAAVEALAALDRDAFIARLERFRLDAPVAVRAAAARRLGLFGLGLGFAADGGFVNDPDRRVRQAVYEAITVEIDRRREEIRNLAKEPPFKFAAATLLGAEGSDVVPAPPSAGADPVDVGLRADLLRATLEAKVGYDAGVVGAFLIEALRVLPEHETEPRQFVVAAAAAAFSLGFDADAARAVLKAAAGSSEPGVAKPALSALAKARASGAAAQGMAPRRVRSDADYLALARASLDPKPVRARIATSRGAIVVRLRNDVAPFAVESFTRLANRRFFDGLLFHRVVPGFVAQAGCPRGDGYGGPGASLPCEVSDLPYERGTLGMALAGKDTGGSQWFLTHRRTPHLEGKYAVFGAVEEGFDVLDALVQGDRIRSIVVE
jgi:cyclophilin family peptidyl-prolyl cis-trans isomerase